MVDGRHHFGVVLPIFEGMQLWIDLLPPAEPFQLGFMTQNKMFLKLPSLLLH